MSQLEINLHNLTREHLAQAKPHLGECFYASPCIIGTLVPEDQRPFLDQQNATVVQLFRRDHLVEIPADQELDAQEMQSAFDIGNWAGVLRIANKYIKGAEL